MQSVAVAMLLAVHGDPPPPASLVGSTLRSFVAAQPGARREASPCGRRPAGEWLPPPAGASLLPVHAAGLLVSPTTRLARLLVQQENNYEDV